jgi:electron transport complex protein RnfC
MLRQLFRFNGGVKPAYHKEASTELPIATVPMPTELVIPLHQSIGGTPHPLVSPGDRVLKGQRIGSADGNVSVAVHASTSGLVRAVEQRTMPHPSGLPGLCVVLEPDGLETWCERDPFDFRSAHPDEVRDYLRDAGIVGLGGAVFPSHLKLNPGRKGKLDTLVINGAECEPFITCDDVLMRERPEDVLKGVVLMRDMLEAQQILIGIEDNKPEAIAAMQKAAKASGEKSLAVVAVPTRYPAGGAKQLIRVLTGIEVPHGQRSTDYGVQCFNVGTAYAIYEAIALGRPMVSRIVTVGGNVAKPRNYEVLFGTRMSDLLRLAESRPDSDRIIMGGPMMGIAMPGGDVPVVKATNCVLAGSAVLFPPPPPEMPCIRCGECAKACPADLQPFEMYWFARAKIFGKAQEYHLFDCIECGCCAYVCPSKIPLVDYYRFAKTEIWAREREKEAADTARQRYEFRLLRDERDKQDKAAKLAAKAAATREKLAAAAPALEVEAVNAQALIAAAVERVQQQAPKVNAVEVDTTIADQTQAPQQPR